MGPYCMYCDKRCFVERRLPFQTSTLLMATCDLGMAHDRRETGHDFTTAVNPARVLEACCDLHVAFVPATAGLGARRCCDPNDCGPCCENCPDCPTLAKAAARSLVVRLEGQVAHLVDNMGKAARLLHELGSCECVGFDGCDDQGDDGGLVVREVCTWCRVSGLLSTAHLDPTGIDRLFDALGLAVVGNG